MSAKYNKITFKLIPCILFDSKDNGKKLAVRQGSALVPPHILLFLDQFLLITL
jgi:hypothetical protein